jgi:hypothetical protein
MFDILVSKYLDGSLSADEDRTLRTILSENPIAKEQFNMAVSLHIAMKDEPEIDIDDKVLLATENAIFSSLRLESPKSQPVTSHSLIKTKHRKTYAPRIAAFFVVFIAVISSIAELKLPFSASSYFAQIENETSSIAATSSQTKNVAETKNNSSQKNTIRLYSTEQSVEQAQSSDLSEGDLNIAAADKTNGIEIPDINQEIFVPFSVAMTNLTMNPRLESSQEKTLTSSNVYEPNIQGNIEIRGESHNDDVQETNAQRPHSSEIAGIVKNQYDVSDHTKGAEQTVLHSNEHKSSVHIRSFLNNGFVYGNKSSVNASSFSQSIGYDVKQGTKVGLEMGQVGFTYAYQSASNQLISQDIVTQKEYPYGRNMSLLGKEDNNNSLPIDNDTQENSISDNTVSLYWGGAFIEQALLNTQDFAINVAGGIGAAGSGPLVFARSYAEYKVNSTISLSIGAEGKTFSVREGRQSGKSLQTNVMIALAYGLQVKL